MHEVNLSAINSEVKENFKKKRGTHMPLSHILLGNAFIFLSIQYGMKGVRYIEAITRQPVTTNINNTINS
ncbi:MAG: hypothetical protein EBT51_11270 [Flavobacteriaceae bacterium]|nr:hypothetical protein [Flavobacteriaceae bacterium]